MKRLIHPTSGNQHYIQIYTGAKITLINIVFLRLMNDSFPYSQYGLGGQKPKHLLCATSLTQISSPLSNTF